MTLTWIKENSPRWDADKQRILGPAELRATAGSTPKGGDARIIFVVTPGRRGRGVGAFILEQLEDEAAARA